MKLIGNSGNDRVSDELRKVLSEASRLDIASPEFSLFAFAEVRNLLERLDQCRLVLPTPETGDIHLLGGECDRPFRKPRNIAELTKERLRRAGKTIKDEHPLFPGDLGFRVFKLAASNIQAWEPDREKLAETLEASVEHLKTDRTEADILFEVLIKLGLDLTVPMEEKSIAGKAVHNVGAGTLLVCLAPKITRKEAEPLGLGIAKWHKALAPSGESTVVFRDSAFADDVAKTNLAAILEQHGLGNVRSL
jgi:adenine-specific DNA-methyltransferase